MKIFTFWEGPRPYYIDLCIQTWSKNVRNLDLHILNHSNINDYLDDDWNLEILKKFSYTHQSDILSVAILNKFGGLFLDADTIITDEYNQNLITLESNKLTLFGNPKDKNCSIAFLYSKEPRHILISQWEERIKEKIQKISTQSEQIGYLTSIKRLFYTSNYIEYKNNKKYTSLSWDFFGNSILDSLLQNNNESLYRIFDMKNSGYLPHLVLSATGIDEAIQQYQKFWFTNDFELKNIIEGDQCGVIALQNSWIPSEYKNMTTEEEFFAQDNLFTKTLKYYS